MKILLFGSTGMLGRYIYSYFSKSDKKIQEINYRILDNNFDNLEQVLLEHGINENTCVINCIGLIPQRFGINQNIKDYFIINAMFPQKLYTICEKYNAKMIQPATDCVFSGKSIEKNAGNYIETDIHDEDGFYGMSKSLGEPPCTVIRTSIIGKELLNKKSFLEWIVSNNGKQINGWTNHLWNGITCLEYCKIVEKIINQNLFWKGIKHIYSPTSKSKYEISMMVAKSFNLNINIIAQDDKICIDKTLFSNEFNSLNLFQLNELDKQIEELYLFEL